MKLRLRDWAWSDSVRLWILTRRKLKSATEIQRNWTPANHYVIHFCLNFCQALFVKAGKLSRYRKEGMGGNWHQARNLCGPVDFVPEVVFEWRQVETTSVSSSNIWILDFSCNLWILDRRYCLSGDRWSQPVEIAARHLVPLTTNDQRQLPVVISLLFSPWVSPLAP